MGSAVKILFLPAKAKPVFLHSSLSVGQAKLICFRAILWQVNANLEGVLYAGGDEHVHQLRSALRRLRTARRLFALSMNAKKWAPLDKKTDTLEQRMGEIRDLDVLIQRLQKMENDNPLISLVRQAAVEKRHIQFDGVLKFLVTHQIKTLMLHMQKLITTDSSSSETNTFIIPFASEALEKQYKKVKNLIKKWDSLDDENRHLLRRRVKRLTITAELFSSLFSQKKIKPYLKVLHHLQKSLGNFNDYIMFQVLLSDLGIKHSNLVPGLLQLKEEFNKRACLMKDSCTKDLVHLINVPDFWSSPSGRVR